MAPDCVDMSKAVRDYDRRPLPGLTRDPYSQRSFSPSAVHGDATLATEEKGRVVVELMVKTIVAEIEELRLSQPPPRLAV